MECNTSKEYCSNFTCKLTFKTRLVKQVTWTCNLIKRIDVVSVDVVLYYRFRTGYKKFLIDVTNDFCAYHGNHVGSAVFDLVGGIFKNYTKNLWRACPFYPGEFALTNLPLIPSLVQNIFVPAGEYKLLVNVKVGDEDSTSLTSLTSVTIFANIPAGRTLENDSMG